MTPGSPSLIECLERHAAERPDGLAVTYLGEPSGPLQCTYAELHTRAQTVAARLLDGGAPGMRVRAMVMVSASRRDSPG